ncbi:MAG: DUF624 domain-containing protein [Clostridiales bacterium]|nr:DUF624 domain-containing protein [Clostridiales bacterium]
MDQTMTKPTSENASPSFISRLGDVMLLNFCFLITCLPVVTTGAAATALYFSIYKRHADHSDTPVADFFRSFKKNLRQGIILTVFLLIYMGGAWFFLYYSLFGINGKGSPGWCLPVAVALVIPTFFIAMFIFPYLARFKNTCPGTIFHSFTFSMMYLGHTVTMWLIVLVSLALMILFPPLVMFVPYICCNLCRKLCEPDFNYAILLQDKRDHPERYPSDTPDKKSEAAEDKDEEDDEEDDDDEESDGEDEYEDSDEDEEYEDDEEDYEEDDESDGNEVET